MLWLTSVFVWLVVAPAHADITSKEFVKPLAQVKLSPMLASCIAGCEHAGTARDCFDYCFSRASNDGVPDSQRQALNAVCGHKAGPALAECLTSHADGAKGGHVREAELHGSDAGSAH